MLRWGGGVYDGLMVIALVRFTGPEKGTIMSRTIRHVILASILALGSLNVYAQTNARPVQLAPGHDMNEQNINQPGMRELMWQQQGQNVDGTRPARATGHDMNEQNEHQPGMHERMRREAGSTGAVAPRDRNLVIQSLQERRAGAYSLVDNYNS
jgi:hypothetical protein